MGGELSLAAKRSAANLLPADNPNQNKDGADKGRKECGIPLDHARCARKMSSSTTPSQKPKPRKRTKKAVRIHKVPVVHSYYKLKGNVKYKDDTCGMTHFGKDARIEISASQDDPRNWSNTFWHEWFHAVFQELGWTRDMECEAKVEGLSHAVMAFIVDPHGREILKNMLYHIPEKR